MPVWSWFFIAAARPDRVDADTGCGSVRDQPQKN